LRSHKQEKCIAAFKHCTIKMYGTQKITFDEFSLFVWYGWVFCCHSGRLNLNTKDWYPFYSGWLWATANMQTKV